MFDLEEVEGFSVDVTSESAVKDAFARVAARSGGIDILVNNAGRVARKPATDLAVEEWQAVMDVNLTATFVCSRIAHPYMKERGGGAIVNVASIMGLSGGLFPNASYQASKGGVVNLTRALAFEWAADAIRVNAVAPTFVSTDLTTPIFSNPEYLEHSDAAHAARPSYRSRRRRGGRFSIFCSAAARCVTEGLFCQSTPGFLRVNW